MDKANKLRRDRAIQWITKNEYSESTKDKVY